MKNNSGVYFKADGNGSEGYQAVSGAQGTGLRERSDLRVLELTGRDRQTFLQGMMSNDVRRLEPGQSCRAALLDSTAHVLASLAVLCLPENLLLAADSRCLERVAQTLDKYLIMEKVAVRDVSDCWSIMTLQGADAKALAHKITQTANAFVVPGHYSAAPGFDIWLPTEAKAAAYDDLVHEGAVLVTQDDWETLRVEAGVPAWGHELSELVLLPEAGLADHVSYTKGCYVGQEIVARINARGHTNRALAAVLLAPEEEAVPKLNDTLWVSESGPEAGREVGRITSAVHSPKFHGQVLCLGYLRHEQAASGTAVVVHLSQSDGSVSTASGQVRLLGE